MNQNINTCPDRSPNPVDEEEDAEMDAAMVIAGNGRSPGTEPVTMSVITTLPSAQRLANAT